MGGHTRSLALLKCLAKSGHRQLRVRYGDVNEEPCMVDRLEAENPKRPFVMRAP